MDAETVIRQEEPGEGQRSTAASWLVAVTTAFGVVSAAYLAGWVGGAWSIRWEELLAELTLLTCGYWLFAKALARQELALGVDGKSRLSNSPWLKWPGDAFPTLLAVLLVRAMTVEPFGIPSESMVPTLDVGDQVIVNKFSYGLKIPVLDIKVLNIGAPERGDVVVFRSPVDPKEDWIKRVVGIPGDKVVYKGQRLYVNGEPETAPSEPGRRGEERQKAKDGMKAHDIVVDPSIRTNYSERKGSFPLSENCDMNDGSISCIVPRGQYFVMGDNRDHSEDSRKWGFVPEHNLVGRASLIWHSRGSTPTGWIN